MNQLRHVFNLIDTNHDGGISIGEDLAYFDHADTNGKCLSIKEDYYYYYYYYIIIIMKNFN